MELKWLTIMMVGIFGAMFIGLGIESHYKSECRLTAIKAGMSVEDIAKVCR